MAENKVRFLKGTATEYANAVKDDDTFYYTTDDGKFYVGEHELTDDGNADTLDGLHANEIASNPNLLINPDFAINQRGLTEYTIASGTTYTVDRWAIQYNAKATTNVNGGIHLNYTGKNNSGFYQAIDNSLSGKTVTFSFKASGSAKIIFGVWRTSTSAVTLTDTPTIYTKTFQCSDDTSFGLWLDEYTEGAYMDIEWAKVEISPIATPFCPPNPATELAKCQRYFVEFNPHNNAYCNVGMGTGWTNNRAAIYVNAPVSMRGLEKTMPTLSVSGSWALTNDNVPANDIPVSIATTMYKSNTSVNRLLVVCNGEGIVEGQTYSLRASNDTTAKLSLSAEL